MRFFMLAATIIPIACMEAPVLVAPVAPTIAQCEAFSVQRDVGPGTYRHWQFIRDCVAGRYVGRSLMTWDECEALSEQRGAGAAGPGHRAHRRFMAECMAGRIPRAAPPPRS